MGFPNGLAFLDNTLFVADSEGIVYRIGASGAATAWSSDPLLAPMQSACGGVVPLSIGANGIIVDANNVYVTKTNFGRLVQIPILSGGSAGAAAVIAESCGALAGADGVVKDADGSFLVAVNAQNRIARVTPAGAVSVVVEGGLLATPASIYLDDSGGGRRLLVTNSTFFAPPDAGVAGVIAVPLP